MVRDTLESLEPIATMRDELVEAWTDRCNKTLAQHQRQIPTRLKPEIVYLQVPGSDPSCA